MLKLKNRKRKKTSIFIEETAFQKASGEIYLKKMTFTKNIKALKIDYESGKIESKTREEFRRKNVERSVGRKSTRISLKRKVISGWS